MLKWEFQFSEKWVFWPRKKYSLGYSLVVLNNLLNIFHNIILSVDIYRALFVLNKHNYKILTGNFSLTASTGCWKGQEKLCFHKAFRTTFCRYCSWFVHRPFFLVFMYSGGAGLTRAACRLGRDILNCFKSLYSSVVYRYLSYKKKKKRNKNNNKKNGSYFQSTFKMVSIGTEKFPSKVDFVF